MLAKSSVVRKCNYTTDVERRRAAKVALQSMGNFLLSVIMCAHLQFRYFCRDTVDGSTESQIKRVAGDSWNASRKRRNESTGDSRWNGNAPNSYPRMLSGERYLLAHKVPVIWKYRKGFPMLYCQ